MYVINNPLLKIIQALMLSHQTDATDRLIEQNDNT